MLINKLKFQSSSRHNYRCAADANLFDAAGLALNFETDAARTIDEVALFDHETIDAFGSFDARRVMIDQVTAQRPSRAAGGGIFADILSDEKSRVGACFADFNCLSREGITAGGIRFRETAALAYLIEQRQVRTAIAEVGQ